MVKLVYLSDRSWHREHRNQYTEAHYYRWNHGPYAREVLTALSWMDGIEIVEQSRTHPNGTLYTYFPGEKTRLADVHLDPQFRDLLLKTAKRWNGAPLKSLLDHVYSDDAFEKTNFGDPLLENAR